MFRNFCFSFIFGLIAAACVSQDPASQNAPSPIAAANPLGQAIALYHKGDFDGAIAKYRDYQKDHPHYPDGYAGVAKAYLKEKRVDDAAQAVTEGLAQVDSPRLRVVQAEVWFRQGKIDDAETQWAKVINSGFPEARAYLGLARVRRAHAMYKTAKRYLDKAHEIDPGDPDITDEWVGTLTRPDRIKYLESSLSGENNWDPEERSDVASYLDYLKERAKHKNTSPCRLVSKVTATETPLVRLLADPQHLRGYGLAVQLNGHKSSLMLDTGASGILVKRAIAEHAGINKITETKVLGIGKKGRRDAYVGVVDSIKIGELEFQNCPIEVMESRSVAQEDGLIGSDVLQDFLVDIDFPNEKLKLSQLPKRPGETANDLTLKNAEDDSGDDDDSAESGQAKVDSPDSKGPQDRYIAPEMQNYTRIYRFGHQLLIPTSIGRVPQKLFILDTGALSNFISPAAAREVTKVHLDSDMIVEGISGRVDKVYSANKAVLQFGHLRQENQEITAFDTTPLSNSIGTEVSGFLGFTTLRILEIKIDYRDALVDFWFDAKRFGR